MFSSPLSSSAGPTVEPSVAPTAALPFDAILMAAGAGSRIGHRPKCLLQFDGLPLILRQINALKAAGVEAE